MNCPVCDERLRPVDRSGIEIDICPGCKGIWLDRGELEKLLAMEGDGGRAFAGTVPSGREAHARRESEYDRREHDHGRHGDDHHDVRRYDEHGRGQRRRGSWLGDILGGLGGDD